jgi:hypothetical protein
MLWSAFQGKVHVLPWIGLISGVGLAAWALTRRRGGNPEGA